MPDQRKKPEKSASSNTEDGGVYRIKDVTQSAWEQGKLPLPGLAPNSAPTLTPLNKADEDMAVELAMTGEIPLAVILSALAKEQDAAKKQTPVPVPKDEPEIQPLGQGSYGAGMIRPDEIIAHTPDPPPVAQAAEAPAAAAQPPQKADPKKVKAAKAELEEMAKRAAPPAVATDVTIEKPVAEPQTEVEIKEEPKVEKKEAPKAEKKPAPQQAKKQPAAQKKPAATTPQAAKKPAATAPQAAKKPAATAPQAAKKPAATTPQAAKKPAATAPQAAKKPAATAPQAAKKPAATAPQAAKKPAATAPQATKKPAATAPQATKKPAATAPQATKKPAATKPQATKKPAQVTPGAALLASIKDKADIAKKKLAAAAPQAAKKPAAAAPQAAKKPTAAAAQPTSPPQGALGVLGAIWNDDVPLYQIPYQTIAQTFWRDVYYFGLRTARPLLLFRRRMLPVLLRPVLALWFLLRASVMAVYHVTFERLHTTLHSVRAAHREHLLAPGAKRSAWQTAIGFFRDYRLIFRTASNILLPVGALVALLVVIANVNEKTYALKVTYNGQVMYVANEAAFLAAQESALSHITVEEGAEGYAAAAKYEIVEVSKAALIDEDTVRDTIWQNFPEEMANGCGVYVDGKLEAVVRNESDASSVLESIKQEHAEQMRIDAGDSIGFVEKIELVQSIYPTQTDKVMDAEGLNKLLTGAKEGELADIATEDDTLYSIAARHGTTARWLERLNPQFVDNYLHGGDKVIISQEISFLQIKVIKTETSTVPVKYEVVNTNSDKYYKGEQKITTKGVPGEEIVTKIVTYVNGVVTASEEIDRVRTKAPVTEQVLIGSKSTRVVTTKGEVIIINPSAQGFVWPTPQLSTITSPYGYRSSGFHTGMDISGSGASGKLVVAAKDGTVESVTRSGSGYGNQIVINHGNGVKTRYAHLYTGSMSVSPGDRVTAGQPIARVGSTGNSTGPHLHFEVIINGKTQNPKNYLKMP